MSSASTCYTKGMGRLKRTGEPQRVTLDMPQHVYDKLRETAYTRRDSMNKIAIECIASCLSIPIEQHTPPNADNGQEK